MPPKALKTVQEWKRGRWIKNYQRIAPPHQVQLPKVPFLYPHPGLEAGEWSLDSATVPEQFVLELPFGRTIGRHGAVVTRDNVLLGDVSREFFCSPEDHPLMRESALPLMRRLKGRYALLNGPGNSTYHWMYDNLTRLAVLFKAGFTLDDFDGFLMTKPKYEPHYEMLDLLGIPRKKIIWCTKNRHFECTSLVVASFTNNERQHHPFVFPFLKSFLPSLPASGEPRTRLYISRKDAVKAQRRIVNEAELMPVLERFGFRCLTLGDLGFLEQARLFASAEFVIAPHGGGLSNLCFCEEPAKLLELFTPDYMPTYYRSLAYQLSFDYEAYVGEAIPNEFLSEGWDMRIDPAHLESILQKMLA